jgi:hypothetical protein
MKLRSCFAAAAAAFLLSTSALAAGPTAEDRATARALAAEGHEALDAKNWAVAADRFARADSLVHAPTLVLGMARAQAALGKIVAANEAYNRILREDLPPNSPKVWTDAVEEARKEVALIAPRLAWITLTVKGATGHEDDLHLIVDGVELPAAAANLPRAVDAGQHTVVASMERSPKQSTATVKVVEGQRTSVNLEVTYVPPPPGWKRPLRPGEVPPPPPSKLPLYLGYGAIGLGGLGIVMGAATGGAVIAMHPSLAKSCTGGICPQDQASKLNQYNALGAASTAGFVAGAAIAGTGIILVVTAPKQPVPAKKGFAPNPNPGPTVGVGLLPIVGGSAFVAGGSF